MTGISGKHAVVTGAGRGIGRAIAGELARDGVRVTLASRTSAELEGVAKAIRDGGGTAQACPTDVSQAAQIESLFARANEGFGPVDILINGAGVAPSALLAKTSEEQWRAAIEVNLSGVFYTMRRALPEMIDRRFGRIVNVASIASKTGSPYTSAYTASKHGVLGLTRCAALEVARAGVTVNAVCPGYVDTPMTDTSVARIAEKTGRDPAEIRKRIEASSPQGRMVSAEEVSALACYLCSDAARGINGQGINVDGGTVL